MQYIPNKSPRFTFFELNKTSKESSKSCGRYI
uniref:Uncharacterized protein n=1 Tax=Populus trichocarpa TaxID=3694 RepID=A0A3N7EPS0_POPTR